MLEAVPQAQSTDAQALNAIRRVGIIGAPLALGAGLAGVDLGPAAMRIARLNQRIAALGYDVRDLGDIPVARQPLPPPLELKARYLKEISKTCETLAREVFGVLAAGEFPLVL